MGLLFKTILAFCIGAAALSAAQRYWLSAMINQVNEVSSRKDWLPEGKAVEVDLDTLPKLNKLPQFGQPVVIPATRP